MATWHLLWLLCSWHVSYGYVGGGECCPVIEREFFIWYFIWGGNWGQWDILLSPADTA